MSSMHPTDHDLNARLSQQAAQFDRLGGAELDVSQVLARAGEIKRGRRMRATMLMAACVLAIAVPTALVALGNSDEKKPSPAPPPTEIDRSTLTLHGLEQGAAPGIAYSKADTVNQDGSTSSSTSGEHYVSLAEYHDGLVAAVHDGDGNLTARTLGTQPQRTWPMEGDFAVSADGMLLAFVQPDGTPVVLSSSGTGDDRTVYTLPRIQRGSGFDAVAVDGQGCRKTVEFPCQVWVTSHGVSPESWTSTADGVARRANTAFETVTDVASPNSPIVGVLEVREDLTTCSGVASLPAKTPTWKTCDYRLLEFSPDDRRLLATASTGDGLGDTQLAVLDATTGKVELDLKTADQVFIGQMVWEDDSHVLATVFQGGQWAVLRIGLDGRREYAEAPVRAEDLESPFVLASR